LWKEKKKEGRKRRRKEGSSIQKERGGRDWFLLSPYFPLISSFRTPGIKGEKGNRQDMKGRRNLSALKGRKSFAHIVSLHIPSQLQIPKVDSLVK